MENSERQRFEENWKSAFENAEQSPSDRVWWSIDTALTNAEGGSMRREVVFYKRLAAASVVLALALAGSTTYYLLNEKGTELAVAPNNQQSTTTNNQKETAVENLTTTTSDTKENTTGQVNRESEGGQLITKPDGAQTQLQLVNNQIAVVDAKEKSNYTDANQAALFSKFDLNAYDPLTQQYATDLHPKSKLREVTIVRKLPAMPASMMADSRKKKSTEKENLWAAVNASTGSYGSTAYQDNAQNFLMTNQPSSFNNLVSASSKAKSKGSAYSVGVNIGTRLAERWVLQGGVSYLSQNLGYTSNFAALDANNSQMAIVAEYTGVKQNITLSSTSPYDINSVSELVSIPVQAGYMFVNRKFGLQLNSGVATDMFIRNTLTDKSGQLSSFSESAGSDSPYNTFSWTAIGGTELSYKIGSQYRISVTPGFRYALTPMLKSSTESASPFMWDMGFRFRYILK
jgi:hypothetical protein